MHHRSIGMEAGDDAVSGELKQPSDEAKKVQASLVAVKVSKQVCHPYV